jgi:hypothetical protein
VYELDESKLTPLIILKYKAIPDAKKEPGDIEALNIPLWLSGVTKILSRV